MQIRDGKGPPVVVLDTRPRRVLRRDRYGLPVYRLEPAALHSHGALIHEHPLGKGAHRHGERMTRYWRDQNPNHNDGYHARRLGAMG